MSAVRNRAIVRETATQSMGGGDVEVAVRAYAQNVVYHNPVLAGMPSRPSRPDAVRMVVMSTRQAFPDMRYTIESLVAEEDRVALLYSWTGTHTGAIGDVPATGRVVSASGAIFCRLSHGKIVEQWDIDDRLAIMQQLGMLSTATPGQG